MTPHKLDVDEFFLTPAEVAKRYRISESTLANQRSQGVGLRWLKINGAVRYPASALADAEAAGQRGITKNALARALHRVFGKAGAEQVDSVWKALHEEAALD